MRTLPNLWGRVFFLTTLFALLALGGAVEAAQNDNVSGWAWSTNIGWVKLNNCTDPAVAATCTGQNFGVQYSPSTALFSGYAWSANIGWVNFGDVGCPNGFSDCRARTEAPATDGTALLKGFVRACAVFESGCSGALRVDAERGEWDGFISLGDTDASADPSWGVVLKENALSKFAWGSDIVGWLEFKGKIGDRFVNLDGPTCVKPKGSAKLVWETSGMASCTASSGWSGSKQVPKGEETIEGLETTTEFKIECADSTGSKLSDTHKVEVKEDCTPIEVDLTGPTCVETGKSAELSWTTKGVSSCTASDGWTGSKNAAGGKETINNLEKTTSFKLACETSDKKETSDTYKVEVKDDCDPVSENKPICGKNGKETGEACDNGSLNGACPATCSTSCTVNVCTSTAKCGDGTIDPGEECDGGSDCTSSCKKKKKILFEER